MTLSIQNNLYATPLSSSESEAEIERNMNLDREIQLAAFKNGCRWLGKLISYDLTSDDEVE